MFSLLLISRHSARQTRNNKKENSRQAIALRQISLLTVDSESLYLVLLQRTASLGLETKCWFPTSMLHQTPPGCKLCMHVNIKYMYMRDPGKLHLLVSCDPDQLYILVSQGIGKLYILVSPHTGELHILVYRHSGELWGGTLVRSLTALYEINMCWAHICIWSTTWHWQIKWCDNQKHIVVPDWVAAVPVLGSHT